MVKQILTHAETRRSPHRIQSRTAELQDKSCRMMDGGGLYLVVNTDGAKYWRMDYRYCELHHTLAFGKYSEVTFADTRDERLAARKLLGQGIDPSQGKKEIGAS